MGISGGPVNWPIWVNKPLIWHVLPYAIDILLYKSRQFSSEIQCDGKTGGIQFVVDRHAECMLRPVAMQDHGNVRVGEHSRDIACFDLYHDEFHLFAKLSSAVFWECWLCCCNLQPHDRKLWTARRLCRWRTMSITHGCWLHFLDEERTRVTLPESKMI